MGTYTTPKPGDRLPFGSKRGASMTDAELQIIEFLMTSDATRPADLPDLLALLHPRQSVVVYNMTMAFPNLSLPMANEDSEET